MKEKRKIFISSPVIGLEEERKALIAALALKYKPEATELWVSSPEHPKNVCLEKIRNSDAVILISGPYYGSVDRLTGKSFTELEYDEAEAYGRKVFHFYKLAGKSDNFESKELSEESRLKHLSFYNKIWQYKGPCFRAPDALIKNVLSALDEYWEEKREELRPLVQADEYFKDYLNGKYYRHTYLLVGREKALDALSQFTESDKKVFVLMGRGGTGKSKLLYEFAHKIDQHKNRRWKQILFLRETFEINQSVLGEIPQDCIIVLDDAHRYADLDNLLSIFKGNPVGDKIKLIISARPLGIDNIRYSLSRNVPYQYSQIYELEDLSEDETDQLVRNLLVVKNPRLVNNISRMTKDCPLATIVACNLINEGHEDINVIHQKEEFQRLVFDKFLEEFKGKDFNDLQTQKLLEFIAALSPVAPSDDVFRTKMSDILEISISDLSRKISILENHGLLLRKGRLVKIVPDLVSDNILYQACINQKGVATNFSNEVVETFRENYFKNILFNLGEAEWKARNRSKKIDLLGNVWKQIIKDFKKSPIYLRIKILDEIEKAAVFQPEPVLEIINLATTIPPAPMKKDDGILGTVEWSNESVIRKLPNILRRIAYNLEYFEKSCDILWNLGKQETRELNPYPEAPIRILMDLAEYGIRKPVTYNAKILDCIKKWLNQKDAYSHRYSPLEILTKLLAKEGEDTEFRVDKFIIGGFPLNFTVINSLRREALNILQQHLDQSKPKHIILKALEILVETLSYPMGICRRKILDEEITYLEGEQKRILEIIKHAIPVVNSMALNTVIKKDLRWYQLHGRSDVFKAAVTTVMSAIPESDEFRIYRALIGNYREFLEQDFNWERQNEIINEEARAVAKSICSKHSSADKIFHALNRALNDISEYHLSVNPSHVLSEISKQYHEIALGISTLIVKNPNAEISKYFSSLIWPLRLNPSTRAKIDNIICSAIRNKDYWPCLNIASALSYEDSFSENDYKYIKSLLMLNNIDISNSLFHGLATVGKKNPRLACEMSLLVNLEQTPTICDNFCSIYDSKYGASIEKLTNEDIENILGKLLKVNLFKGQHWHAEQLLKQIADRYPDLIISFLLKRLAYSRREKGRRQDFVPLPYLGFKDDFFNIGKIANGIKYVRIIRDLAAKPKELDTFWLPKLFQIVSNNFSNESKDVLIEWIKSGDAKKLEAVSILLREFDQSLLFNNHDFIGALIYQASLISDNCLKNVKSNLFGIAVSGSSTRSRGKPSEKDVQLKEKGNEISLKFEVSHPAYKFYKDVSEYGDNQIKEELDRDQEMEYD